jgi:hypothetical protein
MLSGPSSALNLGDLFKDVGEMKSSKSSASEAESP